MYFYWEAQEIEKQKDTLACIQARKDLMLLLELDAKVENGREPEEEDDPPIFK